MVYTDVLGFRELFTMDFDDALAATMERSGGEAWPATLISLDAVGIGVDRRPVQTAYLTDPDGVRIECISGSPDLATPALRGGG